MCIPGSPKRRAIFALSWPLQRSSVIRSRGGASAPFTLFLIGSGFFGQFGAFGQTGNHPEKGLVNILCFRRRRRLRRKSHKRGLWKMTANLPCKKVRASQKIRAALTQ